MSYKYSNMVPKNPHCTQVFIISLFITGKWGRSQLGNAWTVAYLYNKDSVQSLSRVWLLATPWTAARQASLSITNSWSQTHVQNKDCLALKRRELLIKTTHIILRERRLKGYILYDPTYESSGKNRTGNGGEKSAVARNWREGWEQRASRRGVESARLLTRRRAQLCACHQVGGRVHTPHR